MTEVSRNALTTTMTRMDHTSWCVRHLESDSDRGWCEGESVAIGGVQTHLTQGELGDHRVRVAYTGENPLEEVNADTARLLGARLTYLAEMATTGL